MTSVHIRDLMECVLKVNLVVDFGARDGGDNTIQEKERTIISISDVVQSFVAHI